MKAFGRREFETVGYLNFESSSRLKELFIADFNIERIIASIEIEANQKIIASKTLLLFDEVQEAEKGLTALKYFYEQAPEYYIIAAGSLLGISMQKKNSFPVGKVDFMKLYPLSFREFLLNLGEEKLYAQLAANNLEVLALFRLKLVEYLRLYYFIGGMPETVAHYIEHKNIKPSGTFSKRF
ncbi:MAG: AAA family ATPase [Cyclobacteriaceae bacterium]|nr:AAA family ATPase [Cyclobacteriaceae bacterium]